MSTHFLMDSMQTYLAAMVKDARAPLPYEISRTLAGGPLLEVRAIMVNTLPAKPHTAIRRATQAVKVSVVRWLSQSGPSRIVASRGGPVTS